MGRLFAVEIVYRGIFQKTLAKNISRGIVLAAHREGKPGISFGRYGDSPERNGIPAKTFAIVATDDVTLEEGMAQYYPKEVDVCIVLDDTLCKGIESWAWYGLEPVNQSLKAGGTLAAVSLEEPDALLKNIHRREQPYRLGTMKGIASYSGMWVYKDDHTDVRMLGVIAKILPELVDIEAVENYILDKLRNTDKAASARKAYERFASVEVAPGEGNAEVPYQHQLPGWQEMPDGVSIKGQPQGAPYADPVTGAVGGFRPARNDKFKKYTTRSWRPVVNFQTCTKCTLCWLNCPDGSFDVAPDGTYDANMESCVGCGICEVVCPVENCITMVNENQFGDNQSQWEWYRKDPAGYMQWLATIRPSGERSQGFRYRGQYQEQVPAAMAVAES